MRDAGNFEPADRLFLASVLLDNRSVMDLLNADWTFVNEALAQQYDIAGVRGPQFRRVKLANENRFGLLGKGAFLLRTSYADRTSPVLRGAWILDRIVGTPPTPPPPNVGTLAIRCAGPHVRARLRSTAAIRRRGTAYRSPARGENFDNTGRWSPTAGRGPYRSPHGTASGKVLEVPLECGITHIVPTISDPVTKR